MTGNSESRLKTPSLPLIGYVALSVLMAASYALMWSTSVRHTEGHFTYALDDPYIHLAIARNLAHHGVWGVTQYAVSSASSSPLWTVLVALTIKLGGNNVLWPFIIGVACSAATTLLVFRKMIQRGLSVWLALASAILIFAGGPLHVLPFSGMEHCLQILLDLVFGFWLLDTMVRKPESRDLIAALAISTAMCLCRYESLFLVVIPFALCLWRREWRLAGAFAAGPILAVGGFGLYSHLMGMPWVPNSILIKGHLPHSSALEFLRVLINQVFWSLYNDCPALGCLVLIGVATAGVLRLRVLRDKTAALQIWLWTIVVASLLHAGLAMVGLFYRYEAYLIVSLTTAILLAIHEVWRLLIGVLTPPSTTVRRLVAALSLPLAVVLISRANDALTKAPNACQDIYLQQIQMARFVVRFYPTGRLAANDIGAVSYFSHVHLLDIVGLATDDIRQLRIERRFTTATLTPEIEAFKPDVIIAYPEWFKGSIALPPFVIPVEKWTIPPVTSAASNYVEFYATTPESADRLRKELNEFKPTLPSAVNAESLGGSKTFTH